MTRPERLRWIEARLHQISTEQHVLAVERAGLREQATELRISFTAEDAAAYAALWRPNVCDPV